MFKYLTLPVFLLATLVTGYTIPTSNVSYKAVQITPELEKWVIFFDELLAVIKLEEVVPVLLGYLHDTEVTNLAAFLLSAEFRDLVMDLLSIKEFKEIVAYLESKGYDVESLRDFLDKLLQTEQSSNQLYYRKGINGLVQDLMQTLPIEKLIQFFQNKLETHPEFADLYETFSSDEFIDILKRISENEKFLKLKAALAGHGFVLEKIIEIIKDSLDLY